MRPSYRVQKSSTCEPDVITPRLRRDDGPLVVRGTWGAMRDERRLGFLHPRPNVLGFAPALSSEGRVFLPLTALLVEADFFGY
jgi:hypothetical protein